MEEVQKELEALNELVTELPVDWVGTGSCDSAEKQEREWQTRYNAQYDKIIELLKAKLN